MVKSIELTHQEWVLTDLWLDSDLTPELAKEWASKIEITNDRKQNKLRRIVRRLSLAEFQLIYNWTEEMIWIFGYDYTWGHESIANHSLTRKFIPIFTKLGINYQAFIGCKRAWARARQRSEGKSWKTLEDAEFKLVRSWLRQWHHGDSCYLNFLDEEVAAHPLTQKIRPILNKLNIRSWYELVSSEIKQEQLWTAKEPDKMPITKIIWFTKKESGIMLEWMKLYFGFCSGWEHQMVISKLMSFRMARSVKRKLETILTELVLAKLDLIPDELIKAHKNNNLKCSKKYKRCFLIQRMEEN